MGQPFNKSKFSKLSPISSATAKMDKTNSEDRLLNKKDKKSSFAKAFGKK